MSLETMTKLASTTVGVTAQSSISFTNIPQGYTDLVIKVSGRTAAAQGISELSFNSVTTGGSSRIMYGIGGAGSPGSATYASSIRSGYIVGTDYTASTFANNEIYISNYSSNVFKSVVVDSVTENNASEAYLQYVAGLWSNSSPITSLTFTVLNNNNGVASTFTQHSTFTLYGVKNAIKTAGNSIKATGGNITFDGTYVYHVFNSSGTFAPTQPVLADYLVIAGGGGGGGGYSTWAKGGGAGAGGLRTSFGTSGGGGSAESKYTISSSVAVTIGAGGTGGGGSVSTPVSGTDSGLGLIISTGGGSGGQFAFGPLAGGSGGGQGPGTASGAAGTSNQGYAGGSGLAYTGNSTGAAGGGGGAGGVGGSASGTITAGIGGAGLANSITGTSVTYAGGGGGSSGNDVGGTANGGGGAGGTAGSGGTNGTANTGGGGGGGSSASGNSNGGNGGSGLVIIRYKG
jgi:hypothetical protein